MKKRAVDIVLIGAACVAAVAGFVTMQRPNHPATRRATASASPTPTSAATPTPDPLTIAAIASRSYPGSAITTEQALGEQSGYHNFTVSFTADGLKEYALLSVPDGAKPAGGWPVIILCHGYIDPAAYRTNDGEYQQFIAAFAQAGYVVLKPDFRGHGNSQGVPEGGHFSPVYTYDVMNLIASIKRDSTYNPKRIGLFAHSMGGHTALRTAVISKDIKATVLMAGVVGSFYDIFYNWPNSPVATDQPAIVQTIRQNLIAKYGTPKTNSTFWDGASAVNYVSQITGPVQVNQDVGDTVVPKAFADHLVGVLQQAGKPVDYRLYSGNDHQFVTNRSAILQNALAFYKTNL